MIKCFICNNKHDVNNYINCNNLISLMVSNCYKLYNTEIISKIPQIYENKKSKNKKYKCDYCDKILSSGNNYKKHVANNVCQKIKQIIKCLDCNKFFTDTRSLEYHKNNNVCKNDTEKVLTNLPLTTNNTTNNMSNSQNTTNNIGTLNNNNNIQINVNSSDDLKKAVELLPFRETGYKVTTEKYLEYASNPDQAIKQFIKEHHLNPDKPERMNILNTNRRDNRVQLFDYDEDFICRWQTKDKSKIIELLYDRGMNHLFFAKMMLDCAGVKLDTKKETKLKEKIKEYENDKVKKQCLDMISDMTYDYREIVETNKKLIDKQQKLII